MGLETATYISQLNASNPVGATDPKSQGDDHLRLIKLVLQAQFPNLGAAAVTATAARINEVVNTGFTGFAASSVEVGPAAVAAGVATTALRSDARLKVNLDANYAWTGVHTYGTNKVSINGTVFNSLANPSGEIGLAAVNGTDSTAPRTDARHALSQAIAPSWSEKHIFARPRTAANEYGAIFASTFPAIGWRDTDGGANAKAFIAYVNAGAFKFDGLMDDESASTTGFSYTIVGGVPTIANFTPSSALQYGGIEVGYRGYRQHRVITASDNTTASDPGGAIFWNGAGGATITLDDDCPINSILSILNVGSAAVSIAASSLFWMNGSGAAGTGTRTLAVGGWATCFKQAAGTWYVTGIGLS